MVHHNNIKKIFCFEPCYDNYRALVKNTADFPNVYCFQLAVSDTTGVMEKIMRWPEGRGTCGATGHSIDKVIKQHRT